MAVYQNGDWQIGLEVFRLSKAIRESLYQLDLDDRIDPNVAKCGWLIGIIAEREKGDLYQKDLENEIPLAKSTITGMVQTLERAGYLQRISVERDARLKKVILTDAGRDFQRHFDEKVIRLENQLRAGISEEELSTFARVIQKMKDNFEVKS